MSRDFSIRTFRNKLSERWKLTTLFDNATFIGQTVPDSMQPGATAQISITLKNSGTKAWDPAKGYMIGSQQPPNNITWGAMRFALPQVVASGSEVTITATITAPIVPGEYPFQWKMQQEGVQWFGATTQEKLIHVGGDRKTEVPDVQDFPAVAAARTIRGANLVPKFTGTNKSPAHVVRQFPAAGSALEIGGVVTMELQFGDPP